MKYLRSPPAADSFPSLLLRDAPYSPSACCRLAIMRIRHNSRTQVHHDVKLALHSQMKGTCA